MRDAATVHLREAGHSGASGVAIPSSGVPPGRAPTGARRDARGGPSTRCSPFYPRSMITAPSTVPSSTSGAAAAPSPRERPFAQVDVFGSAPYAGNPVAVVLDAEGLSDERMQAIARWTNLSETTFVLPPTAPEADYRLRIWTPGGELPFAGHPTLGSAHAWIEAGGSPADPSLIRQEVTAGVISIRRSDDGVLSFQAPPTVHDGPLEPELLERLTAALGLRPEQVLAHQWIDNGPGWTVLRLASAEEVLAVEPDLTAVPDAMVGVIGALPEGSEQDLEMRTFAPGVGVAEDPVCGSMNASVGQWLLREGIVDGGYRVRQGTALGRSGDVRVGIEAGADGVPAVWVGGPTTTLLRGTALA